MLKWHYSFSAENQDENEQNIGLTSNEEKIEINKIVTVNNQTVGIS